MKPGCAKFRILDLVSCQFKRFIWKWSCSWIWKWKVEWFFKNELQFKEIQNSHTTK